ncbi:MAG: hypothetical protein WC278_04635 [Bacilli bacterium]|jgi:hypothetical protein|nr:hypothetical protein [Bacilli bacterium]MDD2682100.1 hypothetical protein [Bacilli bacterium]MDD3121444.1 hypothetical protein [Bacilli bacterium]MDD4063489.1 hypothetical protein [Bacilli bacterium]MDD4481983.1 hypothetical protein [Bacilli bacterium]
MSLKKKIVSITPFISLIAFLLLGFLGGYWHPGWVVFLLIPIMPILVGEERLTFGVLFVSIYLVMGIIWGMWHPWWVILLLIPVFQILFKSSKSKKFFSKNITINLEDEDIN